MQVYRYYCVNVTIEAIGNSNYVNFNAERQQTSSVRKRVASESLTGKFVQGLIINEIAIEISYRNYS